MLKFVILMMAIFTIHIQAHEGHNNAPGSYKSMHGGVIQVGKEVNLEVITSGTEVTIFPLTHAGVDIDVSTIKINAKALPKNGKPYELVFNKLKVGQKVLVDLKGANRLPLEIQITSAGKTDKFLIQVEE